MKVKVNKMMQFLFVVICFLLGASSSVLAQEKEKKKEKIVVLHFKAEQGLNEGFIQFLNELLFTEFERAGIYKVISKSDVEAMLGPEKQKLLAGCTEDSCFAEIGKALGVELMAAGNIGRRGNNYLLNLKIINVSKASVERSWKEKTPGNENALIEGLKKAVEEVTKHEIAKPEEEESPAKVAEEEAGTKIVEEEEEPIKEIPLVPLVSKRESEKEEVRVKKKTEIGKILMKWGPYIAGGVFGLATIGGICYGINGARDYDAAEQISKAGGDQKAFDRYKEGADNKKLTANILYGIAGVAGIGAGVLYYLGRKEKNIAKVEPYGSSDGVGFSITGSF